MFMTVEADSSTVVPRLWTGKYTLSYGWDKSVVCGSLIFDRKTNNDSNGIYYKIIWHT